MYRKFLLLALFFGCLLYFPLSKVNASEPIRVFVNGYQVSFNQLPIVDNGVSLVQFRPLFESLQYKITWNNESKSIIAKSDKNELKLNINDSTAIVNGQSKQLLLPPRIVNGNTFVPLRFIGEISGGDVLWDEKTNHVNIVTNKGYYLIKACLDNNLDEIKHWLDQGADPNYYSYMSDIPLNWAIFHHNTDMVRLLIKYGANPNFKYGYIDNLLHTSIFYKDPDIVYAMLEGGADIWIKNKEGNAALGWTNQMLDEATTDVDKGNLKEIQGMLLQYTSKQEQDWNALAGLNPQVFQIIRDNFGGDITPYQNSLTKEIYGLTLSLPHLTSNDIIKKLNIALNPLGYSVYRISLLDKILPDLVCVIKGSDTEFLEYQRKLGSVYNTKVVLDKLNEWNNTSKLKVVGANTRWVVVQLLEQPKDVAALSKDIYAFDPDYVDSGAISIDDYVKEIDKSHGFILWWKK